MRIEKKNPQEIHSVAVIGNYLPRKCGIGTFTTDLVQTISAQSDNCRCRAIAINDNQKGYDYPKEVRFEINQHQLTDYSTAAEFLNINQVDIVSLQHEFGIFGGADGQYILRLLQELQMPVVTTLHTVLVNPTSKQKMVMEQLIDLSARLVVMSQTAVNILHTFYDIPKEKIVYIPHGIPDMPFVDPNYYKDKFNLLGKKVLLTFGLLSENKGIEYVIKALPAVIKELPNLTYIVLGATHPNVLKSEGERYRRKLEYLVQKLNLQDHVIFENHFVPFEELCEYLASTDLYITPYNNEEQITSGTLAYATGTGKAVISTPYWYAKEMLSEGRGILVPFKNADAISDAITGLFSDDAERHQMRKRAYDSNRKSTWKEVGRQYFETFQNVVSEQNRQPSVKSSSNKNAYVHTAQELPRIKLDHLLSLTDDTGLMQHATYTIANRECGYCTDDNSRALIVTVQAQQFLPISKNEATQVQSLSNCYLSFLLHAYNSETGRFRNFMDYSRQWTDTIGSEDAHSRALWSLGITVALSKQKPHLSLTSTLFMRALEAAEFFESPRAIAFTLIGIDSYLKTFAGDSKARRIGIILAERLYNQFKSNESENWPWLENILTYSNGKIPHALLLAGKFLERDDMTREGLEALNWLLDIQTVKGHLAPVGNHGWYPRNRRKAHFDQQPLEANCLIEACIAAFQITGEKQWLNKTLICFNWFLGYNDLKLPLYDTQSGGCRDGLLRGRVNQNQGAESTLAWLLSLTAMYQLKHEETLQIPPKKKTYLNNK